MDKVNVDKLVAVVSEYRNRKNDLPPHVRVSHASLRAMMKEVNQRVDTGIPTFSAEIMGVQCVVDWDMDDTQIEIGYSSQWHGPIVHMPEVCAILRKWASIKGEKDEGFANAWSIVELNIEKSNLLARMIYSGDGIRQKPCPVHKGVWSGCKWGNPECATEDYPFGCHWGSNVTGWLPNEEVAEDQRKLFNANKREQAGPQHS